MTEVKKDIYGFMELYFPKLKEEPYVSSKEQWSTWERFVDMLCMISLVMKENRQPESLLRIGSLLNDEELVRTLEPTEDVVFPHRAYVREIFEHLLARGEMTEENQEEEFPLSRFLNSGRLSHLERLALVLAVCVDRNRKYERIFGVLQEESTGAAKPTVGLCHDLGMLFLEEEECTPGILLEEDSFLNRLLLEPSRESKYMSRLSRPLSLNRQVLAALMGHEISFGSLTACAEVLEPVDMEEFISHGEEFGRLLEVFTGLSTMQEQGVIALEGSEGIGKKFIMSALGTFLGMEVINIRVSSLFSMEPEQRKEAIRCAVLKTVCEDCLIYLEDLKMAPENIGNLQWLITLLQDDVNQIFLGLTEVCLEELHFQGVFYRILLKEPGTGEQKMFWQRFAQEHLIEFAKDVDLEQVVSCYHMTPEKIRKTLSCALLSAPGGENGFFVDKKALEREIRLQCSAKLGQYAKRLESPFVWEDLQVSGQCKEQLARVCDRIRYRSVVNETYGFDRKIPYGRGTSVVLYGPPGTGKTMAAQVVAGELGMDIYRIDLSQIGSKYIGETEKNLGKVFDAARFSNAILFFDEADALFTKRTDVATSNDRYANAETAYLLQKIEEYPGMSILATNVMQNFDNAFKRRMSFIIPIEQPNEDTRLQLWQTVFPKEAPLDKNINFEIYAKVAEITGSSIKSAALSAAYRAAAEKRTITNQDLIEAVDYECRRIGRTGVGNELYEALYCQ